ncbi:hypothetical protein [Burkholderia sp. Nafp2/4-1b]|uniref:hypothetical protein n=1 Tax=Burkholderia sp. Nafp2/4-1b TaxID=2116686 RepID=UPI0013CE4D0A|nr:hypothetical protein [Burkholderia sp. Nafp2/4-1b]
MVFDRYPVVGGEMLNALTLADNAHDDGPHVFPSVATMGENPWQSVLERLGQEVNRKPKPLHKSTLTRSSLGNGTRTRDG